MCVNLGRKYEILDMSTSLLILFLFRKFMDGTGVERNLIVHTSSVDSSYLFIDLTQCGFFNFMKYIVLMTCTSSEINDT